MLGPAQVSQLIRELETDPDVIEQTEDLAEQFRSSLYENEALAEVLEAKVRSLITISDNMTETDEDKLVEQAIAISAQVIRQLLRPMIERVFELGDWNPA